MSRSSSPPGYLRVACSSPLDALSATGIPSSLPSMRKSALQKVVPFRSRARAGAGSWLDGLPNVPDSPMNSANVASSRVTMSSMPTCSQSTPCSERSASAVMMIDRPHRGDQLEPAVLEIDTQPLGQLDVDRVGAVLEGGLPQRRRGHDDPHDAHHPVGGERSRRRDFVLLYIETYDRRSASKWLMSLGWRCQFDGGRVDRVVDERQRDGVLRREVPAERAGRDVGDGGDLVDGRVARNPAARTVRRPRRSTWRGCAVSCVHADRGLAPP